MAEKRKITDKNLYELLEVTISASEPEIRTAYRRKALKCHPDKNKDNPKAAEIFHELNEAFKILADEKAREAYDRTLKAKEQAKERLKELDSKRRKLKEDLERREQAAREEEKARAAAKKTYSNANLSEEESLQKEIDRLRKEGSRALQEEQELIRQQILKEQEGKFSFLSTADKPASCAGDGAKIKIKWPKGSSPPTYDGLMKTFSKFGKVVTLVVGKKCAIVEYENQSDADEAFDDSGVQREFSVEWLSKATQTPTANSKSSHSDIPSASNTSASTSAPQGVINSGANSFADFEAMILGRLSAAAAAQKQTAQVTSDSKT